MSDGETAEGQRWLLWSTCLLVLRVENFVDLELPRCDVDGPLMSVAGVCRRSLPLCLLGQNRCPSPLAVPLSLWQRLLHRYPLTVGRLRRPVLYWECWLSVHGKDGILHVVRNGCYHVLRWCYMLCSNIIKVLFYLTTCSCYSKY